MRARVDSDNNNNSSIRGRIRRMNETASFILSTALSELRTSICAMVKYQCFGAIITKASWAWTGFAFVYASGQQTNANTHTVDERWIVRQSTQDDSNNNSNSDNNKKTKSESKGPVEPDVIIILFSSHLDRKKLLLFLFCCCFFSSFYSLCMLILFASFFGDDMESISIHLRLNVCYLHAQYGVHFTQRT